MADDFHIIVLCNWLVALGVAFGKALQHVLFGPLRPIEIDHIYQNSGMSVMNSLLALVMFSDEFLLLPVLLTLYLQFIKVFHWILKDRFEHLFQHATRAKQIYKSRSVFALLLFLFIDFKSVYSCAIHSFGNNPDVYFVFGFQFVILFLDLLLLTFKIVLNVWELHYLESHEDEDVLEGKDIYMKVLELAHTSANLLIDFFLLFTFIGPTRFPIYLFQNIFSKLLSFCKQIIEFRAYLKASKDLDSKLKDATQEDLNDDNSLCIICREDMTLEGVNKGERLYPKKLDCGHIIHMGCLKSWFERSQVCPLCRAPVLRNDTAAPPAPPAQPNEPQEENRPAIPVETPVVATPPTATRTTSFFRIPTTSSNDNILRLRQNSLIPPDWTLLKLSNSSPQHDQYQLKLNDTHTAKIQKITQHPSVHSEN